MDADPADGGSSQKSYWWQGSLFTIMARAEDSGGALGLMGARMKEGFSPPLHVHTDADEGFYLLEGEIRFVHGNYEFVAGPGSFVWAPRGTTHTFKVGPGGARAIITCTPGGPEGMIAVVGVPLSESPDPPATYDFEEARAISGRFGSKIVGPPR